MTRTSPSPGWDQNMGNLLDDLYEQIIERIADGREMTREEVTAIIAESWTMNDQNYIHRRVVDRLTDRDLVQVTELAFGNNFVWDDALGRADEQTQRAQNPFALFQMLFQKPEATTTGQSLAVIHATGPVVSGRSSRGDGPFASNSIGSKTMIKMLGKVRDDDNIKGAVIRIQSPGGSALASEVIWQAVRDLAEQKPVFCSIGRLAASGGYYIACGADEIYVSPQSIVGSIGVVGGKIVLGGLYDKLNININRRTRGPLGDMFNSVEPFNDTQRDAVRQGLERVYEQFTNRVKIGRGARLNDIEQVAKGRVFTGRQAVNNGLADKQGGVDTALADLAERTNLKEGGYDIVHLPAPMGLGEFLNGMFGAQGPDNARFTQRADAAPWIEAARATLGPDAWASARQILAGLVQLREEPALTLMPYAIHID